MKNKQLENKQLETKDTLLKKAEKILAPLLVAGIMTVTGNAEAKIKTVKRAPAIQNKDSTEKKTEMKIKKGDVFYIEPVTGKGGRVKFIVNDVNAKGVRLGINGIIMGLTYGTKSGFVLAKKMIIFTVERTDVPKVAKMVWEVR